MISHSIAHIEPKAVDAYFRNSLNGVPSQPRRLESRENIGIAAKEHTFALAGSR